MESLGMIIFETAIGACAIAWGDKGIVGVQLPEAGAAATQARLQKRFPLAQEKPAPASVRDVIDRIVALLRGEKTDLSRAQLDMEGLPALHRQVYEIALDIPPGETLTYGAIARRIGDVSLSQAVGQALGKNPFPIIVPCHRVLGTGGKTGGFSANGGAETKLRMLTIEGARTSAEPDLFGNLPLAMKPQRG
ncbi:methylated-DNA--[protein]-cysteine S-methyltransferase [Phyllobacterium salinisoli]|uniref:Methylated-DNA--[protein]-cysteine S-methyltransferase n=1 Tax=Phyllobacterium salinisoli TaxID=1899321 RepID=A0A368K649_9HYPH|nr:methylated-DNA--[protein]-cysteine S-methyltransferase [Phyllobacterium salinisoli]RCS24857.1 methylated-DNA--[protein]-cysteine S-methyltransferase [Phyllobacterium salinisoli]